MNSTVVFLINSLSGGGAERALSNLLFNSDKYIIGQKKIEVVLLDREPMAYPLPANVKLTQLNSNRSLFKSIFQSYKTFSSIKPEIVISSLTRSNFVNIIVGKILGHKTIICEHANTSGHHKGYLRGFFAALAVRILYPISDRIVCVSHGIKSDLVDNFGAPSDKLRVIPNPIDIGRIEALAELAEAPMHSRPYILGMGRLVISKNFPLMIEAFAKSSFKGDLFILGQGPQESQLQQLCIALGVKERVFFLGFKSNPFPLIKNSSAFVLSSNGEGLPTSIIEAFALGTPVISTDCRSGPAELLDEAEEGKVKSMHRAKYGILVPPNDVVELANAMSFVADDEGRAELARASRKGISRYGLLPPVLSYWKEINSVL